MNRNDAQLDRRDCLKWMGASGLAAAGLPAQAQDAWPSKPIRWIVPFAPGGTSSIVARSIAAELTKQMGANFVIDNKGGGGGVPAMQEMLRSPADGYTIIMSHIGLMVVNPLIYPDAGYDVNKDFTPVTLLNRIPSLFCVHKDVPVTDLKSFIAYAKSKPGQLNYASAGNASAGHLAVEALKLRSGIFMTHIPYRGTGPALTDVLAGRIEFFSAGTPALLPHIKSGALRCLAVGSAQRIAVLPDVPSVSELFPGFETVQWYGIHARAGTPPAIITRLQQECAKALRAPDVVAKHEAESAVPGGGPPKEYADFVAKEQARWKEVVIKANIKPG
ncbi:MAG: tripartite tricarboxylate transporter substrate binding protein [Burkholderiales bacterium]|nr:tripartite tricarboxylate transporter substrate binding protein [Burkholderiales bacterium]